MPEKDINSIIEDNQKLVYFVINRMGIKDDDAYSQGLEALWKAALFFDETMGVKFSTYAYKCIYRKLLNMQQEKKRAQKYEMLTYERFFDDKHSTLNIESDLINKETIQELTNIALILAQRLTGLEQRIILCWIESKFSLSMQEIGNIVGCSRWWAHLKVVKFKKSLKGGEKK